MALVILAERATWADECRYRMLGSNDTAVITDDALNVYADMAERDIRKRQTDYATILSAGGDDKEELINATICQLCGKFVTVLRNLNPLNYKVSNLASETKKLDFDKMEADFYNEVNSHLNAISTAVPYYPGSIRMTTATQPATFDALDDNLDVITGGNVS